MKNSISSQPRAMWRSDSAAAASVKGRFTTAESPVPATAKGTLSPVCVRRGMGVE